MTGYTVTVHRYDEQPVPGKPLGRHRATDTRSALYPYRAEQPVPVVTILHDRHIPILNQGDLGSCVGNAAVGALATDPIWGTLGADPPTLDEDQAVALYSEATQLDSSPGAYPPDDTGTDGLSVCKALTRDGDLSGYTHALTISDVLQALMAGPVLVGIDWYSSFDSPATNGLVTITGDAHIRGGHEIVARGVDADRARIQFDNSWGPSWGASGSFFMAYGTLERLLADGGDAIVPVPLSVPAPVPVPPPPAPVPVPPVPPLDRDLAFARNPRMVKWASGPHHGLNGYAAQAFRDWANGVG